jgi:predicted Zn-dependent peptidase
VRIVDRPGAAQTELRVGHAGVGRTHPDRAVLRVLNSLLGGKFTSRINLHLRERHGYTYGAFSRFADRRGPGPFTVACAASTEHVGAAAREILHELVRLREERVSAQELADTRSYLLGVYAYSLQTSDDLVDRLETLAVHALADDYHTAQLQALREVTSDDMLAAAVRHLHPEAAVIVAVGPRAELAPQLAPLGLLVD